MLTWWQGPPDSGAVSGGTDYLYNDRYQRIAEVKGGNGYSADGQEFLITPWNTALIIADTIRTANLTSIGGPADQKVVDSIVQDIDISTGKVSSSGTPQTTSPTRTASSRGPRRPPPPGTGSTSMPSTWTPTETC